MPAPIDPMKLQEAMRALGVLPADMDALRRMPSAETAQAKLDELKERVRKNFKVLAFELHPDRTGNDLEKTERFKLYATVKDEFEKIQIEIRPPRMQPQVMIRRPPPQQVRVTRVVMWSAVGPPGATATGATNTGQTVVFNVPFRVATMKPT